MQSVSTVGVEIAKSVFQADAQRGRGAGRNPRDRLCHIGAGSVTRHHGRPIRVNFTDFPISLVPSRFRSNDPVTP
jgi:hypothetical protein